MSSNNSNSKKDVTSARKAYITSDGKYIEEPLESEEVEELKKPRNVAKPQDEVITKTVKNKSNSNNNNQNDFQKKRNKEFEKLDSELEHENDIFDEDGNIIEEDDSQIKQRLKELEQKIEESLNRIINIVKKPLTIIKNKFLLFSAKILSPVIGLLGIFEKFLSRFKKPEPVKEITEEAPVAKKMIHGTFEDMINLNVILTDNYDNPLYKKRNIALAKSEEALILLEAKEAIKQCAEFTQNMPPVQSGIYEGKEIFEIMENVEDDDITLFLGYIKARPQRYVSKSWKMSETFATWLVNNAPVAEDT